jgi:hypothetical protein
MRISRSAPRTTPAWVGVQQTASARASIAAVLALQRTAGNRAVAQLIARAGTDLKLHQTVPKKTETEAVGAIAKKIKRTDPEFATLVANNNADIEFKDEEGTGADRMMTQRLSDKLDALATLVKTEWTSNKLRVTEAWDENSEHWSKSQHYEGRAADLTVDDKDSAKLGRLGRLAVDAGLDWVFYENQQHVHASVTK